ncbi:MAG: response regulator [Chloroflexota bacterium]|nr:response regulator [Chloroflexota bacterium]
MTTHVLVADDDAEVRHLIVEALSDAGYTCQEARDGREAVAIARATMPDLIVLDILMPVMTGDEAQQALRSDRHTRYIPVMFVTGRGQTRDLAARLQGGADDYISKPFALEELLARAAAILRRARELRALNPLSGLPGNTAIASELERHLSADDGAATVYCDLDHFKDFNDHYGFARGDELLRFVANLLVAVADRYPGAFVGHVGGDDFVLIVSEADAVPVAQEIIRDFDLAVRQVYEPEDRERGGIVRLDRRGVTRRMPFVTISLGIVPIARSRFADAIAVARAAAEVKELAKRRDDSSWAIDRRRTTEAVAPEESAAER